MEQVFDGTEALTYRHEPHAGVVNRSAIPYECLAAVRNVREDIMNKKVAASLCDDDPYMQKSGLIDDEHLGSCNPYDGVDETLMGCATEIAEALQ